MRTFAFCAALALAACGQSKAPDTTASAVSAAPAQAAGSPVTITPRSADEHGFDSSVAKVVAIGETGAKLFSTVGGDPAINGEYVFLAVPFDDGPAEEPKVYKLGDFNSWDLESQSAGQFVIKVSRSWLDDAGEVKTADERYIVAIPTWAAAETTITPAG
jgi:ABC-type enterochelin transport system substrate-binding protein